MSKECNIVADLLPLYQDGVCTEDSRELVETHLAGCESCRRLAEQISQELAAPEKAEEIDALKRIKAGVRKGRKKAFLKGAAAGLSALLLVLAGYFIWWYANCYSFYAAFLDGKKGIAEDAWEGNLHCYTWQDDRFAYRVGTPSLTRLDGCIIMEPLNNTEELPYLDLFIEKGNAGNTEYVFSVHICTDKDDFWFEVDRDLNLISTENPRRANAESEFEANRETVRCLVDAAIAAWPFLNE